MAFTDNRLSTTPVPASFTFTSRADSEMGGVALNDASQGLQVRLWRVYYDEDAEDVKIIATGVAAQTLFAWTDVRELSLAFDQNMQPMVAFVAADGVARYWWFDSTVPGMVFSTLPAGSRNPRATLDDNRRRQTNNSDIVLAYLRDTTLYFRLQEDRFGVEYTLLTGGVITAESKLTVVQMAVNLRLQFELHLGTGNTLSNIVEDISKMVGVEEVATEDLASTIVRGYVAAGEYTATDAIRGLQHAYRFDMSEVDGALVAVRRGKSSVAIVRRTDMIAEEQQVFATAREQGVEFPRKFHVHFAGAEADYMPGKSTSERRSPDVRVVSEASVEFPINYPPDEAAQTADILHKQLWAELEGTAEFSLDESWAFLAPADILFVEFFPDQLKRMRVVSVVQGTTTLRISAITDRQSVYTSAVEAAPRLAPEAPIEAIPGDTDWEFLDLPALLTAHDTLHFYVAAKGATSVWRGAVLQRETDGEFSTVAVMPVAEVMGTLLEDTGAASPYYTDEANTLLVSLNEAPLACTRDQILRGRNAVAVGVDGDWEIMQYQDVAEEGDDFRLSVLSRGRLNTTPFAHLTGASVVMLNAPVLVPVEPASLGQDLSLRAPSVGNFPESATERDEAFTGRSQREWAPTRLVAVQTGADWNFTWTPRHRLGSSANPIASTHFTGWRLRITVGAVTVIRDTLTAELDYTEAMQIADFGSAQSAFDLSIVARNSITGDGDALIEEVP